MRLILRHRAMVPDEEPKFVRHASRVYGMGVERDDLNESVSGRIGRSIECSGGCSGGCLG